MRTPTAYKEVLAIMIHKHIKALAIFYILDDLADWILDPFMACEGIVDG